jgi:hypothetical protein
MTDQLRAVAYAPPHMDAVAILLRQGRSVGTSISFAIMPEGAFCNPTFYLGQPEAQELMDSLWAAGLRPSAGKQSEGLVSAQSAHLADMRAIAFAKLNILSPGASS